MSDVVWLETGRRIVANLNEDIAPDVAGLSDETIQDHWNRTLLEFQHALAEAIPS